MMFSFTSHLIHAGLVEVVEEYLTADEGEEVAKQALITWLAGVLKEEAADR
jgi:hypothetical protein